MKATKSIFSFLSFFLIMSTTSPIYANSISNKKKQLKQKQQQTKNLQTKISNTKNQINLQQQKTSKLQSNLYIIDNVLVQVEDHILQNQQEQGQMKKTINQLQRQIQKNKQKYVQDQRDLTHILIDLYNNGTHSYLQVLFSSTSFSDFISRLHFLRLIVDIEHRDMENVLREKARLLAQEKKEKKTTQALQQKSLQLSTLQKQENQLKQQKKSAIQQSVQSVAFLQKEETQFSQQMHLTQQQIASLKQQIQEQEAIMATESGNIVESDLQYQPVSAQKLYAYVQNFDQTNIGYPSDFTLSDMETICQAAKNYNVNPILLVAITGAEESFVPVQFPAHSYWAKDVSYIKNNPFNVYYSWMWTKENHPTWNLWTTANIAANTVRHKLSTAPRYGDTVFEWLNDPRNPWGLYATDRAWSSHVEYFYKGITQYVQ